MDNKSYSGLDTDVQLAKGLGLDTYHYIVNGCVFERYIVAGEFKTRFISSVYEYIMRNNLSNRLKRKKRRQIQEKKQPKLKYIRTKNMWAQRRN